VGLTVTDIPAIIRNKIYDSPAFRAMCMSSWRESAYATSAAIRRSHRRFKASGEQGERAYIGWDIILAVVEMTEMVATAILNARQPERFAVHQATNEQIEGMFTAIRDNGITGDEVRTILGLKGPRGMDARAVQTVRVFESVVERIRQILHDLAVFWLEHIEHSRWFRHYPATLTPDETWLIDVNSSEEDRAMAAKLAAMLGAIEVVTIMKEKGFDHTVLREQIVIGAAWLGDGATQFIMTALANSGIDPRAPRKTYLFPAFVEHLTDDERELLFTNANYIKPI
jgi:hypothetical protein